MGENQKKGIKDGFLELLRKKMTELIVGAIIGIIAVFGVAFRDELSSVVKKSLFYGTVEFSIDNQELKKDIQVTILDKNKGNEYYFALKDQTSTRLPSGNYIAQAFYPKLDGSKKMVYEEPFELERREHRKIQILFLPPNAISVKLEIPKEIFVPKEQIYFTVTSNKDGYIWLFSPDIKGNPNLFFPNEIYKDNHIRLGEEYIVPPYGEDSFVLKTRGTPGEETIVCIITESNGESFAYSRLNEIIPHLGLKVDVGKESLWGYDRKIIKVEQEL